MYREELFRQLALDYCCSPTDAADPENHFSIYIPQEGRRRFQEGAVCGLKIAVINGKLLFTGSEEIIAECRKRYANVTGELLRRHTPFICRKITIRFFLLRKCLKFTASIWCAMIRMPF